MDSLDHVQKDLPHIPAHPLIEYLDKKPAVLLRFDRPVCNRAALLQERPAIVVDALDDGNELNMPRAQLIPEKAIDAHGILAIQSVNRTKDVDRKSTRLNSSHLGISHA